jgi:hypothetical protein
MKDFVFRRADKSPRGNARAFYFVRRASGCSNSYHLYHANMPRLPNCERAIFGLRKVADYCLSPAHSRGRHKARRFRETRADAAWLRDVLIGAVKHVEATKLASDAYGDRWRVDVPVSRQGTTAAGKNGMDRSSRGRQPPVSHMLGPRTTNSKPDNRPTVLDVVALLSDLPSHGLARGQVGTVVESLDEKSVLVEFTDDRGEAYAIVPYPRAELLVLHYVPQAA